MGTLTETSGPRKPIGKKRYLTLLMPALLVAVVLGGVLMTNRSPDSGNKLDNDLCSLEPVESAGRAVVLFDLRKPIDDENLSLPGQLLHDVTLRLSGETEVRTFALSSNSLSPRLTLDRLCKPYHNADLQIGTAKDQTDSIRDCDDLPAQLPAWLRESASRFCARRNTLRTRIEAIARNPKTTPVANSYVIEAIEDSIIELSKGQGPREIYVFSDMLQHSEWYSHLDLHWTDWSITNFAEAHSTQFDHIHASPAAISDLTVRVFYSPRLGLTDHLRPRRAHQAFWREYFAGAELSFEEQPPLPAYEAEPLTDKLTPEQRLALEREKIDKERAEAAQMLEQVRKEREMLLEEQRKLAEGRVPITAAPSARPEGTAELGRRQQSPNDRREQIDARQAEVDEFASAAQLAEAEAATPPRVAEQESLTAPTEPQPETVSGTAEPAPPPDAEQETLPAQPETVAETAGTGNQPAEAALDEPPVPESEGLPDLESIGELAFADRESGTTDLPPCNATLLPEFRDADGAYPGRRRMNYGKATMTVRYRLDEDGATIDDEITVIREQSSAQRPRGFELFANTAMGIVRNWVFDFDDADQGACSKDQNRVTKIHFSFE